MMKQASKLKKANNWRITPSIMLFLVTAVFMLSGASVAAQDLTYFYNQALKFDPQLASVQYEHQASREILRQAYAGLLPSVSFEASHIETRDDIKSSDNTVWATGSTSYPTDTYTLALVQPVFNYATWINVSRAKEELKQYDARLINAKQALITRVAKVYFDTLAARDNFDFARSEQTSVGRNYELARERHAMGLTPIQDMLDSKARFAYVSANTIEAENALNDAFQSLYEISGIETENIVGLKKDLMLTGPDPVLVDEWIAIAMANNAILKERQSAVETARQEMRRIRAHHYPVLDLEFSDNWRDTDGSMFGGGSEVETQEFVVKMKLPIYQGGAVSSQTRQTLQLVKSAEEQLRQETLAVERETRAAFLGVKTALSKVEALGQAVDALKLTLESKQEGYKSGLNTMLDVLDAERDLYLGKRDYAQARYDYILNIIRLKQAVGTLSQTDVAMVSSWLN